MSRLAVSQTFQDKWREVSSAKLKARLNLSLRTLSNMPEYGSPLVEPSIVHRYGIGIRKVSMPPYQIIYQYDRNSDIVWIYDLLYSPFVH